MQRDKVISETRNFLPRLARSSRIKRGGAPSEIQRKAAECASPPVSFAKGRRKKRTVDGTQGEA